MLMPLQGETTSKKYKQDLIKSIYNQGKSMAKTLPSPLPSPPAALQRTSEEDIHLGPHQCSSPLATGEFSLSFLLLVPPNFFPPKSNIHSYSLCMPSAVDPINKSF